MKQRLKFGKQKTEIEDEDEKEDEDERQEGGTSNIEHRTLNAECLMLLPAHAGCHGGQGFADAERAEKEKIF